jgi:hypothetical protein
MQNSLKHNLFFRTLLLLTGLSLSVFTASRANCEIAPSPAVTTSSETTAAQTVHESKDEFRTRMENNLSDIRKNIDELQHSVGSASTRTQKEVQRQIRVLEQKRAQITRELGQASQKTGRAWTHVQSGIEQAWSDLKNGLAHAQAEYDKKQEKKE